MSMPNYVKSKKPTLCIKVVLLDASLHTKHGCHMQLNKFLFSWAVIWHLQAMYGSYVLTAVFLGTFWHSAFWLTCYD